MDEKLIFNVELKKAEDISEIIDTTLNMTPRGILALCINSGTYDQCSFLNVLYPDEKVIFDQKVYKLINQVNTQIGAKITTMLAVASMDEPTDFLGLNSKQVIKRFPLKISGTVNPSRYGNIVKSQEEDVWFSWDNPQRQIKLPTNIAPVINYLTLPNKRMPKGIAKKVGDADISVFVDTESWEEIMTIPEPTSHKVYAINIDNHTYFAVKSKKERTEEIQDPEDKRRKKTIIGNVFYDLRTGKRLFKTSIPVSSVINQPIQSDNYLIQGEDRIFYTMTFQKK